MNDCQYSCAWLLRCSTIILDPLSGGKNASLHHHLRPSPPGIEVSFWETPARPRHRYMSMSGLRSPSQCLAASFQTWKLQTKRITKPQTQRPQPTREDATRERIFLEWPGSQSCISFLLSRIFILAGVVKGLVIKNKKGWQMQQGWHNTVLEGDEHGWTMMSVASWGCCLNRVALKWLDARCGPLVKAVHGCPPLFQFLTMLCENGIDPQSHDAGRNCQSNPGRKMFSQTLWFSSSCITFVNWVNPS